MRWTALRQSIWLWRSMTAFCAFFTRPTMAVERGDAEARRSAVKRALDIIIHLQARLRMDVGGRPAQVLSEFYAFGLRADIASLAVGLGGRSSDHAIECVKNVRDAWRQVAKDPAVNPAPPQVSGITPGLMQPGFDNSDLRSSGFRRLKMEMRDSPHSGDGEFFLQLLLVIEAGVVAVKGEQLVVSAQLHNSSVDEQAI